MIDERKKIKFLTNAVGSFRGLPMMLFGLSMMILMVLNYGSELNAQKTNAAGKDLTLILLGTLIFLAIYVVGYARFRAHFNRKYGMAKAKPNTIQLMLSNLAYLLPILIAFIFGDSIDASSNLPFSMTVLSLSVFTFVLWWINYRGVSNNLLYLSLIFLAAAFLPWEKIFFVVTVKDDFFAEAAFYRAICSISLGFSYFVMGFTDYRILTTMLKPIERGETIYEPI